MVGSLVQRIRDGMQGGAPAAAVWRAVSQQVPVLAGALRSYRTADQLAGGLRELAAAPAFAHHRAALRELADLAEGDGGTWSEAFLAAAHGDQAGGPGGGR